MRPAGAGIQVTLEVTLLLPSPAPVEAIAFCLRALLAWLQARRADRRRYRIRGELLVGGMPGHPTGSTFPAPFPPLDAVYARQQHHDRANPDDNKRKY